jgi:hypothetical protein
MSVDWKSQVKRLMARGADYADVRYYPKHEEDFKLM